MTEPRRERMLLVAVLALSAALRFVHVGADIPHDAELTNAPTLDGYWYLEGASARADSVAFEPSPPYDLEPWVSIGRGWFFAFGAGPTSACALGAAIGVATVLATWAWARPLGARPALVAALLLGVSYPAVQIARTPIIYGPLALLATVASAMHARGGRRARIVAGAIAFALPIALKAHAVALIPGLVAAEIVGAEPRLRRRLAIGLSIGGIGLAAIAVAIDPLGFVTDNLHRYRTYSGEGDRSNALALLERLLTVGARPDWPPGSVGLGHLSPSLAILGAIGVALAWTDGPSLDARARSVLAAAAVFAVTFTLAAVPIQYRPVRYWVPLLPSLAVSAGYAFDRAMSGAPPSAPDGRARRLATIALAAPFGAVLGAHVIELASAVLSFLLTKELTAVAAFAGAAAFVGAALFDRGPPRAVARALAVAVVCLASTDLLRDVSALAHPARSHDRAQRALARILGDRAVLAGPYAPALACGTRFERRRGFTVGLDAAGLRRMGYTHYALDAQHAWTTAMEVHLTQAGAPLRLVAVLQVRSEPILIYRFDWAEQTGYSLTPFEEARRMDESDDVSIGEAALESAGAAWDHGLAVARIRALIHEGRWPNASAAALAAIDRLGRDDELSRLVEDIERLRPR